MTASLLLISTFCWSSGGNIERLLDAIEQVESGGRLRAIGDNGRSHGPYQIQQGYAEDAIRTRLTTTEFHQRVYFRDSSRAIIKQYWKRYVPGAYGSSNFEVLARTHNGGPRGYTKAATRGYWIRVKKVLDKLEKGR